LRSSAVGKNHWRNSDIGKVDDVTNKRKSSSFFISRACLLQRKKTSFIVLEARNRIGGRIVSPEHQVFFADLGTSWYWPEIQPKMAHLVERLGLTGYRQFEEGAGSVNTRGIATASGPTPYPLTALRDKPRFANGKIFRESRIRYLYRILPSVG
jgi:hypothetical protein